MSSPTPFELQYISSLMLMATAIAGIIFALSAERRWVLPALISIVASVAFVWLNATH